MSQKSGERKRNGERRSQKTMERERSGELVAVWERSGERAEPALKDRSEIDPNVALEVEVRTGNRKFNF